MGRMARAIKTVLKHLNDSRGVSLYEITAAVAMTGILAAVAVPVVLDRVEEARVARSILETDALAKAIEAFKKDTGKHPGEIENLKVLVSSFDTAFLDGNNALPKGSDGAVLVDCASAGNQYTTATSGTPADGLGKCGNLNAYLTALKENTPAGYSNYRGPYMDKIEKDQFDRVYSINVRPLYSTADDAIGFGWVFSPGADRSLTTKVTDQKLDAQSDDLGKNLGKKTTAVQN